MVDDKNQSIVLKSLQGLYSVLKITIPPPDRFLPRFRSPCWYMNTQVKTNMAKFLRTGNLSDPEVVLKVTTSLFANAKTLVCLPSVYFIGFPRSGSTQLYQMLLRHPDLVGGNNKEPHWWTKTHFHKKLHHSIDAFLQYLSHYLDASRGLYSHSERLLVDGSQSTIWDTRRIKNLCALPRLINSVVPEAKFIVLMRHPVQRLFSDMKYLCEELFNVHKNGTLPESYLANSTEIFLKNARLEIQEFQKCLLRNSLLRCTHYSLTGFNGELTEKCGRVRLGISLYHVHIRQWLKAIPRERFLFLRTEELAQDPFQVLQRVWTFLELPEQSRGELADILHQHTHSTQHQSLNIDQDKRFQFLHEFFQPHSEELDKLLQINN